MHLMHVVTLHLHDNILCEVWVDNQLHEGSNEAPQPPDCHTIAAMIDTVLVAVCIGET